MLNETALTRRRLIHYGLAVSASSMTRGLRAAPLYEADSLDHRPAVSERKFRSAAIEAYLQETSPRIADPVLRAMFNNCFPNTLDTTVFPGEHDGKPDTAVVTGDIAAMWLRDSSAQVWPYLPFAGRDPGLRRLLEGVIR